MSAASRDDAYAIDTEGSVKQKTVADPVAGVDKLPDSTKVLVAASVLHELRTPLNQIIGYSELLGEQAQEDGLTSFVQDLQKIRIAGQQLLGAINSSFASTDQSEMRGRMLPHILKHSSLFPANLDEMSSNRQVSVPVASLAGHILVVDDGEQNRIVLSKRLMRQGSTVVSVSNGLEALTMARSQSFDMVLLDIMMPEMDGYEVLQRLKGDATLSHIPVVMISALSDIDSIARCISLGADDYLIKPFDPTLLKARVGACLEKKKARDREQILFNQLQLNMKTLQELEKQRDDLTSMIVHDLRTPLTSIIGGLNSLRGSGDLNSEQQEMMDISVLGGESLLGMINDLLDVEKLGYDATQLDRSVVSIPDIIAEAVMQVSNLAEDKQLSITYDVAKNLPQLSADEGKLRRIMVNLLGNAIKFTPVNGRVVVAVKSLRDFDAIELSVGDSGEGIPTESLSSIFEKFTQVASPRGGGTMSTGLGLAFCKLAVEAHGGHITVESEIGHGSTFIVTLPCSKNS